MYPWYPCRLISEARASHLTNYGSPVEEFSLKIIRINQKKRKQEDEDNEEEEDEDKEADNKY